MKKTLIGTIVSDKMNTTAVVAISVWKKSRLFGKRYRQIKKIKAHNPENNYKEGAMVKIEETRPLSRHKSWQIIAAVEKGEKVTQ